MIREKERLFRELVFAADLFVLLLSFGLACWFIGSLPGSLFPFGALAVRYRWLLWVILPTWSLMTWKQGLYDSAPYRSVRFILWYAFKAHVIASLVFGSAMYLSKSEEISRLFMVAFVVVSGSGLVLEKILVVYALRHFARQGRLAKRRVLLVGEPERGRQFVDLIRANPHWGMEIAGMVEWTPEHDGWGAAEWAEFVSRYPTDEVIGVFPWRQVGAFDALLQVCAERGTVFRVLLSLPRADIGTYHMLDVGAGNLLISLETVARTYPAVICKRLLDILAAIPGLIACGIVWLWYAPRLKRESPGPVLFKQERGGCNGRVFTLYKFRTMYPDAEARHQELADRNEMSGLIFKLRDDPRVLPSGRLLRRYHLDELPQFWNVLVGEMSLVGPRPCLVSERALYRNHHHRRFSVRPGITGPWQILGNGQASDFDQVVRLDCEYIDQWSFSLDAQILFRTGLKVLRGSGW